MIEAADLLANLAEPANSDAALVRRGRYLNTVFLLGIGEASFYITIAAGRVARIEKAPKLLKAFSFSVKAGRDAWNAFWQPIPRPGFHDLFALTKGGHAAIEGDVKVLLTHLRYLKELLATPRGRMGGLGG